MSVLTEERQMLADMSRRVASEHAVAAPAPEHSFWRKLAELGLCGLLAPEEFGGVGASAADVVTVAMGLGAARYVDAFLSTSVLGVDLIRSGTSAVRDDVLRKVVAGTLRIAVTQPAGEFEATGAGSGFTVTGRQAVVLGAGEADVFIVLARSDATGEPILFLIDRDTPGVSVNSYALIDGRSAGDLLLDQVSLDAAAVLADVDAARRVEDAFDLATVAVMGEALGALEAILAATVDHLRTRHQFGRPLSSFQVLRHRIADIYMAIEEIRSMTWAAAAAFDEPDRAVRQRSISQAKIHLNTQAVFVAEQGVQLHGAMGVTEESSVGRRLQQITVLARLFGSTDDHLDRLERHRLPISETRHDTA